MRTSGNLRNEHITSRAREVHPCSTMASIPSLSFFRASAMNGIYAAAASTDRSGILFVPIASTNTDNGSPSTFTRVSSPSSGPSSNTPANVPYPILVIHETRQTEETHTHFSDTQRRLGTPSLLGDPIPVLAGARLLQSYPTNSLICASSRFTRNVNRAMWRSTLLAWRRRCSRSTLACSTSYGRRIFWRSLSAEWENGEGEIIISAAQLSDKPDPNGIGVQHKNKNIHSLVDRGFDIVEGHRTVDSAPERLLAFDACCSISSSLVLDDARHFRWRVFAWCSWTPSVSPKSGNRICKPF